jgi:hypothetical protein
MQEKEQVKNGEEDHPNDLFTARRHKMMGSKLEPLIEQTFWMSKPSDPWKKSLEKSYPSPCRIIGQHRQPYVEFQGIT